MQAATQLAQLQKVAAYDLKLYWNCCANTLLPCHLGATPLTPPRRCTQARRTLQAINPHKLSPKQWREEEAASKRSLASLHTSAEVRCLNNWLCCHV